MAVKIVPEIKFGPDGIGLEFRVPPELAVGRDRPGVLSRFAEEIRYYPEWVLLPLTVLVLLVWVLLTGGKP